MILWGMIGILQCLFLPGIVALRGLRAFRPGLAPHTSGAGEVFLAVLLSLALNHWLVVVLVALEIYSTELTRALFLGEFVVLAALALREQYTTGSSSKLRPKSRPWTEFVRNGPIAASLCLALFAYFANAFVDWVATWDSAFTTWDAVVSWNHWATVWASGQRPSHLWEYPQLIPILISIVYRVAGDTEIQLFAKAMITGLPLLGTVCYFYVSRVRREDRRAHV